MPFSSAVRIVILIVADEEVYWHRAVSFSEIGSERGRMPRRFHNRTTIRKENQARCALKTIICVDFSGPKRRCISLHSGTSLSTCPLHESFPLRSVRSQEEHFLNFFRLNACVACISLCSGRPIEMKAPCRAPLVDQHGDRSPRHFIFNLLVQYF